MEKTAFYNDLISHGIHLKMQADNEIAIWRQPGAKGKLLRLIVPCDLTSAIEKEMRYQETVSVGKVQPEAKANDWVPMFPKPG